MLLVGCVSINIVVTYSAWYEREKREDAERRTVFPAVGHIFFQYETFLDMYQVGLRARETQSATIKLSVNDIPRT